MMKVLRNLFILIILTVGIASGQDVPTDCTSNPTAPECQKVVVTQQFVSDATRAFTEVVALRDTVQKFLVERAKTDAEKQGARVLIESLNEAIAIRDKINTATTQLVVIYDKIIKIQNDIIDKLQTQLNKPKGFFANLLQKVKDVALIVTGVLIGRGF